MKMIDTKIRNFTVNGVARDQMWIIDNQLVVESYIHEEMRAKGFLPVLDERTDLRWDRNDDDTFSYRITIKAIKVGKRKAQRFRGAMLQQGLLINQDGSSELIRS